jgi:hypothetical protein
MSDIQRLLELLKSANPNKRFDACEELRVSSPLPPEALEALQLVTNDTNPSVADAAQRALAVHNQMESKNKDSNIESNERQDKKISILDWILRVIAVIFLLIIVCIGLSFLVLPCGIFGC